MSENNNDDSELSEQSDELLEHSIYNENNQDNDFDDDFTEEDYYQMDREFNMLIEQMVVNIIRSNQLESFISNAVDSFITDPIEDVLIESLNTQPTLNRVEDVDLAIPSQEYRSLSAYDREVKEKECCICLTKFEDNDNISILPECHHILHTDCVKEWGKYKTSCPICRTNLDNKI